MSKVGANLRTLSVLCALTGLLPTAQADPDVATLEQMIDLAATQHASALQQGALVDAAMAGVTGWLNDFHQSADHRVLSIHQYQAEMAYFRGDGFGLGVDIRPLHGHGARVIDVFADSPAANAGVVPGMAILGIDGYAFAGKSTDEILNALRSTVTNAQRSQIIVEAVNTEGVPAAKTVTLGHYHIPALSAAQRADHLLIDVRRICMEASRLLQEALATDETGRLVLDLRRAEGVDLDDLLILARQFLGDGQRVGYFDALGQTSLELHTGNASAWEGRIVVLVSEGTRGTAELLAAALREQRATPLIGTRTAGQGQLPSYHALPGDRVVQLVAGSLRTPEGMEFNNVGVQPDERVMTGSTAVISPLIPPPDLQYDAALRWLRSEE